MNVDLKTTGNIQVYDLQTRFATTSGAPGMKALCQAAITNDGRIDKESLMMEYNLSESAVRNLFSSGISCGVWDSDGVLTDDGYNTAKTGEVMVDEVGPLRIWVFDHETTGTVLLHAERLGLMPPANVEPQAGNSPEVLSNLSNGRAAQSLKAGDNRRWRLQWTDEDSAWAIVSEYCSKATLSWSWTFDNSWIQDRDIVLKGNLNGVSNKKSEDGISVQSSFSHTGALNPDVCMRNWLSAGRFTTGPWDTNLKGLKKPFSELSDAEKSLQITDEILDNEIEEWEYISINEIPLFSKNLDDATDWTIYLINEETPGYTTTEDTDRKLGDILQRSFMCLDDEEVRKRVESRLSSSRADPRLSKLLHAGDDLDGVAFIPEWVLSQKRNENIAIHDGTDDYTEFVNQMTQNMKGKIKKITYVNNYLVGKAVRKRLALFMEASNRLEPDIEFEFMTSHYPFTKNHGNDKDAVDSFRLKIKNSLDSKITFMDEGKYGEEAKQFQTAHDRVIIIESEHEARYWKASTKGIHIKDKSPCMRVEFNELENWLQDRLNNKNLHNQEAIQ